MLRYMEDFSRRVATQFFGGCEKEDFEIFNLGWSGSVHWHF